MRRDRNSAAYGERRAPVRTFEGFDADAPVAGFYEMRLIRDAHPVGIRIWHGAPIDPETGEELDRGWRWQATANGRYIELDRVWPKCADNPVSQARHDELCRVQTWAEEHAPDSPQANPHQRVNLLTAPIEL